MGKRKGSRGIRKATARAAGKSGRPSRRGQEIPWDLLLRGSHKFLERASVKRGESLLLITEPPSDRRLADGLFEAAYGRLDSEERG